MFQNRLQKVQRHLGKLARRRGVSCYRLYDHDLPEFPFCIEWYGNKLYVAEYQRKHSMNDEEHATWLEQSKMAMAETLSVAADAIFLKRRQRKENREGQYRKLDEKREEFIVEENGLQFIVNLSDYLDTGLFLDHRLTRERVRAESEGKNVLNLFAYTGSFSVYAAAGGAARVETIDLSNTYVGWAKRNMEQNGFSDDMKYVYQQADVLQFLKNAEPERYDLIIMDPPTFSNSKRMNDFLDIQRDHAELINDCLRILKAGGVLYFSTNLRSFSLNKELLHSKDMIDLTRQTTPFDFEGRLHRFCFSITK